MCEMFYFLLGLLCDVMIWVLQIVVLGDDYDICVLDLICYVLLVVMVVVVLVIVFDWILVVGYLMGVWVVLEMMCQVFMCICWFVLFDIGVYFWDVGEQEKCQVLFDISVCDGMMVLVECWLLLMVLFENFIVCGDLCVVLFVMVEWMLFVIYQVQIIVLFDCLDVELLFVMISCLVLIGVGDGDVWSLFEWYCVIVDVIFYVIYVVFFCSGYMVLFEVFEVVIWVFVDWMVVLVG